MTRALVCGVVSVVGTACDGGGCPHADLSPVAGPAPAYAVVSSDYASTSVALLDADGELVRAEWIDSGTTESGIVATLSGDVSLPSAPQAECEVALLDRFGTDVMTLLDPCGQDPVRAQVAVGLGFAANPQDMLRMDDGSFWVSRLSVNLAAEEGAIDRGDDIAIVDLGHRRVIDRIALDALDDGPRYARPSRMARLRAGSMDRVIVATARLSADFADAAEGAVAVIDPETRAVERFSLAPLTNCGELDPVVGEPASAIVTCAGPTFGVEADRRASAGLAWLELGEAGTVSVRARWIASEHPDVGVPFGPTVALGRGRLVTIAAGDVAESVDRLLAIDLDAASATVVLEASEAFVLGEGAYDLAQDLLLIPDAAAGVIRRLRGDIELPPIDASGCRGLPPREVAALR
ncbi:MAG: hypothetical protein AB7S26_29840 [Sandaracinaceae bacterium]